MSLEVLNRGRLARGYNLAPERGREREYGSRRGRRRWRKRMRRGKRMLSLENFKCFLNILFEFSLNSIEFETQLKFRLLNF